MTISFIIATLGKKLKELDKLVNSICKSQNKAYCEIIIISQLNHTIVEKLINHYSNNLCIRHIKSDVIGLSYNRNIGIKEAKGEILAFPDDDCYYKNNAIHKVLNIFLSDKNLTLVSGIQVDPKTYSTQKFALSKNRFFCEKDIFKVCNSITIFIKKQEDHFFDEKFGTGKYFGACEETDYVYRYIMNYGGNNFFDKDIIIFHNVPDYSSIDQQSIRSYARGYGAFFKKDRRYFTELYLAIEILIFQPLFGIIVSIILFQKDKLKYRIEKIIGIWEGFINFTYD
tara:strand:- start:1243 stop:2094 length:852 start_codon:yes stop_codon:yes gene_type:complete